MSNAFKYRDYRLLWGGSFISNLGDAMQEVAEDWLILTMTGSPFLLGLISFCKAPSRMLLGPMFGVIIDRVNRKNVMIAVAVFQMVLALAFGILVTTKLIQFWHIVVIAILGGLVLPLVRVTRQTVIPDLVPRKSLLNAISLNSVGNHSSQVIGPLVGGLLIAWFGIDGVFYINALSFGAIIVSVIMMRLPPGKVGGVEGLKMGKEIGEGMDFVKRSPVVFDAMMMQFFSFLLLSPFTRLLPIYAKDILAIGPTGLGLLRGFYAGGSILGGLGLMKFGKVKNKEILWKVASALMTFSLIAFSHLSWLPLSSTCLVIIGISTMIFRATSLSVIQLNVPDQFRGRVMGLYNLEAGFRSIGGLLYGSSASLLGTPITVALGGGMFGLVTLANFYLRSEKKAGSYFKRK